MGFIFKIVDGAAIKYYNGVMREYVGMQEAAEIMGISRQWVLKLIKDGELRHTKLDRGHIVLADDARCWKRSRGRPKSNGARAEDG